MPRKNKRRRNNHNNNRKKVKQLNSNDDGVTIGGQPTNVTFVGDGTERSIELAAHQTEMGSDNSKIDCIVVVPDGGGDDDDDSVEESENKNELSENENKIEIDDPNMSNGMDDDVTGGEVAMNGECVDQNNVINQSNVDSDTIGCSNIVSTGDGDVMNAKESCNDCSDAYNKQNKSISSSSAEPCGDVNSIQEPKSTNKTKIPKAVIANCFTYDSCTETTPPPPPHVTSDVDHESAQIEFTEKCSGSIPNDTNISEDKTNDGDSDKRVEPSLALCDKVAFNPIMQEITNNNTRYRVDSPGAMTATERPKLVGVKKSRSMDDNDVLIQEMSDTGSIGDNDHTPIISEAESEVESDIFEISPSPSGVLVSVQTIPFSGPLVDLSAEEEELIQNLINEPKSDAANDKRIQKIKKRSALENHFLPQFLNPKFLDVIKEETSDTSDVESKNHTASAPVPDNRGGSSFDEELDDDVFLDSNSMVQKTNAIFPKINLNFSGRRKHVSHLKSPSADVIREEPQCFLVDTKLVDPDSVEESCSKWTTSVVSEQPVAELVYIGSSSSSASDANDQESVGEADAEDSCDEDSDVRIKTPIIGCDDREYSLIIDSGFKSLNAASESESLVTNSAAEDECVSESIESAVVDIEDKDSENICDTMISPTEVDDSIPKFKIGAPCSNNMFAVTNAVTPSALNDLPKSEFARQDSSGSICSSISHSTSQSQSTARFCATSPPRDLADFEGGQCVSGASSLTQQIKTLRQIAVDKLMSMPYGPLVLEELAIVAESLGHLTDQPNFDSSSIPAKPDSFDSPPPIPPKPDGFLNETSPPIPPKPQNLYENSPPPVPPKPLQNRFETSPPPPIPPKPANVPVETSFIDPFHRSDNAARQIEIVQLPATSPANAVPINRPMINSALGVPIEQHPSVSPCRSPSQQRNFIGDSTHLNEIKRDLLLEMHSMFVNRRGYREHTDIELIEPNRDEQQHHLMNDHDRRHNETVAKNDDNNRLLAIIRDSKQSTGENSAAHNVECDRTFFEQSGDKMSSIPSAAADGNLKMSNGKQIPCDNRMTQSPSVRTYSNIEKTTYETRKRVENGNVVFEFSNSTKETSTDNNGNKECTKESTASGDLTDTAMMKSDINLEKKSVSSTSNNKVPSTPSSPINNSAGNMENAKNENKSTNQQQQQQQRNVKAKSEYFDDKISFREFDYVPKFFSDDDFNQFFNSNHERSTFEESKREENHYQSSDVSSRPQSSLQEWLKEIDDANSLLDNIVKPIVREENLCKGMGSKVNVRAPRVHTVETSTDVNDKFDEAQRRYEMYVTKQNHIFNRQSMIDKTPITPHVSTRRKSLPKELQQKQLEYIRKKEQELNYEFDKLEHDRMRLLQEIEEMKVNQHVKDFVMAHKSNFSSNNFIARHQSEAELLRQQMHDEWLNKVAEREERRLQKIIKITKPGEENAVPEHGTRKATVEHEFLNRVKERRTKLKMPSDSDWESGAESQPVERDNRKEEKVDPKVKVIEGERETNLNELPKHIKEFASDFTTTTERTDTSIKETTESSSSYEIHSSSVTTNDGIWSPGSKTDPPSTLNRQNSSQSQPPTPPPPPFWAPKSTEPSPTFDRKEFRPVKFESPQLSRKVYTKEEPPVQSPWSYSQPDKIPPPRNPPISTNFNYTPPCSSNIPKSQTNTITLLQKAKENQLPRSGTTSNYMQITQNHSPGIIRPNEVVYAMKNEYLSEQESENERPKKMVDLGHKKIEGIGPTTKQGMPIVLRSEVDENNHHKWYKKMYNTLHKVNQNDDTITVRYKTRRGRYPYKTSGYLSEPEPNYDSDYSIYKYSTLDRRRNQPLNDSHNNNNSNSSSNHTTATTTTTDGKFYGTMPNPIKCGSGVYRNQPGRIENYVTGHSSVSDKERKERTEHEKLASRSYTEGYLSRALKDQGYESDSTLVFRKRDAGLPSPLSPVEQKQAYLNLQAGGEAPTQGFRKQAPEKPKDTEVVPPPPPLKGVPLNLDNRDQESPHRYVESDVNIHYKTPVRFEYKDPMSESELAYRQAEQMKKLYQEERRRKYLQEMQDMSNRRHTDNFTPSQKSPIALNRYDDFGPDASPKSPQLPRTVARALYNFQGQTARELSFKKGDIIYIRREIDKNWFEGEHNAAVGLLPSNYVEIISRDGIRVAQKKLPEGQARAKFNFHAQSAIELSLNKGELVALTRRVDDNWFEGRIANRKGIFPVSYVDVLTDIGADSTPIISSKPIGSPAAHSLTLAPSPDYQIIRPNYISDLSAGIIPQSNGYQTNGVVRETKTIQKTEVLHVDTNSEPVAYRAIYKYRPQNSDELELQEGDIVYVLEKCDDGWFVGTSQRTGYFGTFPGNYVERN